VASRWVLHLLSFSIKMVILVCVKFQALLHLIGEILKIFQKKNLMPLTKTSSGAKASGGLKLKADLSNSDL